MTGEEKIDQRASGLGTTEILVSVTREEATKRKNGTGNRGDKTWVFRARAAVAILIWLVFVLVQGERLCSVLWCLLVPFIYEVSEHTSQWMILQGFNSIHWFPQQCSLLL